MEHDWKLYPICHSLRPRVNLNILEKFEVHKRSVVYEVDKTISRVQMLAPSNLGFFTQRPQLGKVPILDKL